MSKAWNKCIRKTTKWCRKNHRKGESVNKCAKGVCAFIRRKYKG